MSDRILFLDIAHDRYSALPASLTGTFTDWLQRPEGEPPSSCTGIFCELGLGDRPTIPRRCAIVRPSPLDPELLGYCHPSPTELSGVGQAVISAWAELHLRPLSSVLGRRFNRRPEGSACRSDLRGKLAAFRSTRPFIPVPRVCLHDSIGLIDWLGPDAGAALVFGVSAYPFAAHSWVQHGDAVIDDHPESPSRFQPILHLT